MLLVMQVHTTVRGGKQILKYLFKCRCQFFFFFFNLQATICIFPLLNETKLCSLSNSPEVGQQVLGDGGDKLFGCVIQQVTLQHIQHSVESPHAAGEVCAPQRCLQQATHRLCYCFVLGIDIELFRSC